MVTLRDIAKQAGVSVAAVSYCLNGKAEEARIPADTCRRIKEIAEELGYRRNDLARAISTGQSDTIAFVTATGSYDEYHARLMTAVCHAAARHNYTVKVFVIQENQPEITRAILEQRIAGVIFHAASTEQFALIDGNLQRCEIPAVLVNLTDPAKLRPGITSDDRRGAYDATRYLIRIGHRRIAMLDNEADFSYIQLRRQGYLDAMAELLPEEPARIEHAPMHRTSKERCVALAQLLQRPERPEAIFCFSDICALELMQAAYGCGIRVPEELSVVGFADYDAAHLGMVPLTTVAQPFARMGELGVETLVEMIRNTGSVPLRSRRLPAPLVIRESTRSIK